MIVPAEAALFVVSLMAYFSTRLGFRHEFIYCGNGTTQERTLEFPAVDTAATLDLYLEDASNVNASLLSASCELRLKSCDSCRFKMTVEAVGEAMPLGRRDSGACQAHGTRGVTCREGCNHLVEIYEPAYRDIGERDQLFPFTEPHSYTSISSHVHVRLCLWASTEPRVTIHVGTEEKKAEYTSMLVSAQNDSSAPVFRSPNFPLGYARDGEKYLYLIRNPDPEGTVYLSFVDWDINHDTRILFYETEAETDTPMSTHYGYYFRPVLHTPSQVLLLVFEPDVLQGSISRSINLGFTASYRFVPENETVYIPETDCGGYIRYLTGGNQAFSASHWTSGRIHDCIWVIHKNSAFQNLRLQVDSLQMSQGSHVTLSIRSGMTSSSPPLVDNALVTSHLHQVLSGLDLSTSSDGLYMRLTGPVLATDTLRFTFVAYNNPVNGSENASGKLQCGRASEFYCPDVERMGAVGEAGVDPGGLCIDHYLVCDGHAHCPSGHDEKDVCQPSDSDTRETPQSVLTPVCRRTEVACESGGRCILASALCDRWLDCPDGSDEYYCGSLHPSTTPVPVLCANNSLHCGASCVPLEAACDHQLCRHLWQRLGCDYLGLRASPPSFHIDWSLILPICFTAFCVFIVAGIICIRVRRQPKFYVDHSRRVRRCRRLPIVQRVLRCHAPCSATSSCSGNSSTGLLLSRSTSASGGSAMDPRLGAPSPVGPYVGTPTFAGADPPLTTPPTRGPSSAPIVRDNYFSFDNIQTTAT